MLRMVVMGKPNIDFSLGKDFKPKVNHKIVRIFYFAALFFIAVAVAMFIHLGPESWPGILAMTSFMLLIIFLVWLQTSGITIRYHLNPEGIYLKRSWYRRYYPLDKILKVEKLNENQAMDLVGGINNERVEAHNDINFAGELSSRMSMGDMIAFSSIQFVGSDFSSGDRGVGGAVIHKSKMKTKGDFLLLTTVDGEQRLFTPEKMDEFLKVFEVIKAKQ
jgi:hypothetical protein